MYSEVVCMVLLIVVSIVVGFLGGWFFNRYYISFVLKDLGAQINHFKKKLDECSKVIFDIDRDRFNSNLEVKKNVDIITSLNSSIKDLTDKIKKNSSIVDGHNQVFASLTEYISIYWNSTHSTKYLNIYNTSSPEVQNVLKTNDQFITELRKMIEDASNITE